MKGCKCIDKVDKLLEKQNEKLIISFQMPDFLCRVLIVTEKIDPKKTRKKHTLAASFCPFCGKKYPERKA